MIPDILSMLTGEGLSFSGFGQSTFLFSVIKYGLLGFWSLFIIIMSVSFIHLRRVEAWLPLFQKYHLAKFLLINIIFSLFGMGLTFII